jgi:dipeptidyl aminopeptidase/acylaminoacyl peptidase
MRTYFGKQRSLSAAMLASALLAAAPAMARSLNVEDLSGLRDIGGLAVSASNSALSVSPDGSMVAFQLQVPDVERNTYQLTWLVSSTGARAQTRAVADGGELMRNRAKFYLAAGYRPPERARWSTDAKSIFYLKLVAGTVNVWRSAVDGGVTEQVTRDDADVIDFNLSEDGKRVLYTVALPRGQSEGELAQEAQRGYLFDDRFIPYSGRVPARRWCGEGRMNAVLLERKCDPEVRVLELDTGRARAASDEERQAMSGDSSSGEPAEPLERMKTAAGNGDTAWLQVMDPATATAARPVVRLHAKTGDKVTACAAEQCSGYSSFDIVRWRADGKQLYFSRLDFVGGNVYGLYAWAPRSGAVRTIYETDDKIMDCQPQERQVICLHEGPATPRQLVAIDLQSGRMRVLYDPNPEFRSLRLTRIETLHWQDGFGNPAFGRLIYPNDYVAGRRYPLVVLPYDATGFLRGDTGDEYPAHAFAAAGLMVLCASQPFEIENRSRVPLAKLAEASERDLTHRRSTWTSIERMLDMLDRRGLIDPSRVGMTGLSDGAQQVHFALVNSDRIAAAAVSSVATPAWWYYTDTLRVRKELRQYWGGIPSPQLESYRALSYAWNVQRIRAPLLVNVSDEELDISIQEVAALQDAGKPVEMHVFPDEHHVKWQPRHRINIYRRNLQWFEFWLEGRKASDPVDPEQYARWEKMRGP